MAAGLQGRTISGKRSRRASYAPMTEINVTPFVDVMLVLLIVFMVTAPLLTVGVPLELPKTKAKPLQGEKEPLTLSINQAGELYIQDIKIEFDELVPKLEAITQNGYNERIYVRGDRGVEYGLVARVLGSMSRAGFSKIALQNAPEDIE